MGRGTKSVPPAFAADLREKKLGLGVDVSIDGQYIRVFRICKCLKMKNSNQISFDIEARRDAMGNAKMDRTAGKRAKQFRIAVAGYESGRKFALDNGIAYGTWNGIENGSPMSTAVWLKIGRKWPGMAHDWFKYGDSRGLSGAMIQLLSGLPNQSRR